MIEQEYILENQESFDLRDIFECGQCFRWNEEEDGSYTGVVKNSVINVKKDGLKFIFKSIGEDNLEKLVCDYFDLNTNYELIKNEISKIDEYMKQSIEYGKGIRILNQDVWECIISFIISANNNIPRIKGIIEKLSQKYGKKLEFNNNVYYTFPTPEELKFASVEDLRKLGLGFRDIRVFNTTNKIVNKEIDLKYLESVDNTESIREELLKLDGVGPKVADCIMLFSLKRYDVFPIDVWVRRVMNELYIHNPDETKVNKKMIADLAKEKYGKKAGIAQQYLFYYRKNQK